MIVDETGPEVLPGTVWIDVIVPTGVEVTKHMVGAALQSLRMAVQGKGWTTAKLWVETRGGEAITWCRVCVADGAGDVEPPACATVIADDAPVELFSPMGTARVQ